MIKEILQQIIPSCVFKGVITLVVLKLGVKLSIDVIYQYTDISDETTWNAYYISLFIVVGLLSIFLIIS